MATAVAEVGGDHTLLQQHSAATAQTYYVLNKNQNYQESRAAVVVHRRETG